MRPKLSSQAERGLYSAIGKAKSNGLDAVSQLAKKHSIAGVYGPLIELINCPDEYKTAVEVTAGDQLFNIVVDNDETAGVYVEIKFRPNPSKFHPSIGISEVKGAMKKTGAWRAHPRGTRAYYIAKRCENSPRAAFASTTALAA